MQVESAWARWKVGDHALAKNEIAIVENRPLALEWPCAASSGLSGGEIAGWRGFRRAPLPLRDLTVNCTVLGALGLFFADQLVESLFDIQRDGSRTSGANWPAIYLDNGNHFRCRAR